MSDNQLEITPAPTSVTRLSEQPVFYVNVCSVSITPEEAILQFGLRALEDPSQANGVAAVYMSLAHAKRLAEALSQTLQRYEKVFGEIITDPTTLLPQEMREQLGVSEK